MIGKRHIFSWAIEQGHTERTAFKRGDKVVHHLTPEQPRERRLEDDEDKGHEEARLLQAAGPLLKDLIRAGIATGCRVGELSALQWRDVQYTTDAKGEKVPTALLLSADDTKTSTLRRVPVGPTLAAILSMRRHAPDGKLFGADKFVFGNAAGEQVKRHDKAFRNACRRAGIENLRFHDLRREFGSLVLDSGGTLLDARDLLGHADIKQTSVYLKSALRNLDGAVQRKEAFERADREARLKDSHTKAECDNPQRPILEPTETAEVVKH